MAERISDNISKIVREVNKLKSSSREASAETKRLNETLRLDPTNAELMQQRFTALTRELTRYHKQMAVAARYEEQLRRESAEDTAKLATLRKGTEEYDKLEKKLRAADDAMQKFHSASEKAETQVHRLQAALRGIKAKEAADEADKVAKSWVNWSKSGDLASKAALKLTAVLTAAVAMFRKLFNEAVSQAQELYKLSRQYKTTVEDIQLYNRALQIATGENDLFTASLKTMTKGLSTIPVGRGVAYSNALKQIGLSYNQLKDQNPAEQFRTIIESLQALDDQNLASAAAITLLGESGQTIIGALQEGNEDLEYYLKQAEKFAPITQQNAEALTRMSFELEAVKSQIQVQTAQLAIELMPTIMSLVNTLKNIVMPLLQLVAKNGWLIYVVIMAILGLKLYSAVIKMAFAIRAAKLAQDSLNRSMFIGKAVMGGLAAAALLAAEVASAVALFTSSAADSANDLQNAYSNLNATTGASVEQSYSSRNERTVNISVDIYGEGDTTVSDATASTIAQLTADEVNRQLGNLVKGN